MKVALSGKMKSGKSTLAKELNEIGHYNVITLSFASPIREALEVIGITKEEFPEMYREGAQWIGTDFVRKYHPDWWVMLMDRRVQAFEELCATPDYILVIDDMRFENEFDYCQQAGFLMVRLDVSEGTQLARGAEKTRLTHPSETGLDHIVEEEWDLLLSEDTTPNERAWLIADELEMRHWAI